MMAKAMIRTYFSYQELLDGARVEGISFPIYPHDKDASSNWFTALVDDYEFILNIYGLDSTFTDINDIVNILMNIVYDRHAKDYIAWHNEIYDDPTHEEALMRIQALDKLIDVINLTAPKYIVLLKQFKKYSADPTAPITSETSGETKFNDTPQNIGDYGDDDHTTNISNSKSESKVDTGSIMERLSSMYKDFKSIILEWSNEFNKCFIKEEQICE